MKGWNRVLLSCILILLMFVFTGCKGDEKVSVGIVVGNHANAPKISVSSASVKNYLYDACYSSGSVVFVNVDGNPQVIFQADIPEPEVAGLSKSKLEEIANDYLSQLQVALKEVEPTVEEVDTLKAIRKAAQVLQGNKTDTDKKLLILDSGLSTTGYLDYRNGLLYADYADVVAMLESEAAIPDMSGIEVIWCYCGEVVSPQQELTEKEKENLKKIWKEVLMAGGAESVEFANDVPTNEIETDLPVVSTVEVGDITVNLDVEETINSNVDVEFGGDNSKYENIVDTVVLDEASVRFIGDTDMFVDSYAAETIIGEVAEKLKNNPNIKVYIVGTTATGGEEFCNQLSIDRANAVANVLISKGISAERIITIGLGYHDPWHIDDLDENGVQIEELACQNRKVLIMDMNSEDAKLIQ